MRIAPIILGAGEGEPKPTPAAQASSFRFHVQILLPETRTPERCLEAYHLHRTRLELIAERKVRRRQLTDDGNVEITGRDLRERQVRTRHLLPVHYRQAAS